jgi:Zn-dependent protease with chaperone function
MAPSQTTSYRYPNEQLILFFTILLVIAIIALTATATLCLSVVFVVVSYFGTQANHRELIQHAYAVTPDRAPRLAELVSQGQFRLRPGPMEVFIVPNPALNAYTFGLSSPKVVVVYSALTGEMTDGEMSFILGHEMGHISLGHTVINSLVGGMAGIPAPIGAALLLNAAFLWWNRACEYSADRAGLLACGNVNFAVTALVKLAVGAGSVRSQAQLEHALQVLDKEDDNFGNLLGEVLSTHPMIIKRVGKLRSYAATREYQQTQAWMTAK